MSLKIHMSDQVSQEACEGCGKARANRYQLVSFVQLEAATGEANYERQFLLCPTCARLERRRIHSQPTILNGLSRQELITELDNFFAASGATDICRRCHQQGTGCCPSTCRIITEQGCSPNSKYGKSLFCGAFVCGALLNAISECDAETGRVLKWVKRELGPAEFRIYEMITRVPSALREQTRPLALPKRYPGPEGLGNGEKIKEKLALLAEEVLEIRRLWRKQEITESQELNSNLSKTK